VYIQLAPFRLKQGFDEKALLKASDFFDDEFVSQQKGIVRRMLLRAPDGGYADLVFFENKEDADRVAEIEASSEACGTFFGIMEAPDPNLPDMGVLSFKHLKTYE
jgi:hypothetical protein